jgi:hypothetical protein
MRRVRYVCGIGLLLLSFVSVGCGSDNFSVAPAKGTVVFSGTPVTEGSITLVPIVPNDQKHGGKPAKGEITVDGTFVLSTYGTFDGAVIGRHRVIYESPEGTEEDESEPTAEDEAEPAAKRPNPGGSPKPRNLQVRTGTEVEVKSGNENIFEIELVEAPADQSEDAE